MSTSKQNVVKKTPKTTTKLRGDEREPSRERSKTKKEESTTKTAKTIPKTKSQIINASTRVSKPTRTQPEAAKTKTINKTGPPSSRTSTTKKVVPNSPTSSRVVKSQFYPSKQMYSNALTPTEKVKIKAQLQPKNAKLIKETKLKKTEEVSSGNSSSASTLERPSTATLRKGSIVNMNIAGPDVPRAKLKSTQKEKNNTPKSKPEKIATENPKVETVANKKSKPEKIATENLKVETVVKEKSKLEKIATENPKVETVANKKSKPEKIATENLKVETVVKEKSKPAKLVTDKPQSIANEQPTPKQEDEYDYEDDFDSYASDFDEYKSESENSTTVDYSIHTNEGITSSSSSEDVSASKAEPEPKLRVNSADEEKKLDSGNFDLPENKHKQILGNITENAVAMASLSDEGFEEAKSLQFVNFLEAKKKRQRERSRQKKSKRGEELMSMIRLDNRNFTLFDMPPVSYDDYIKSFGNRNSVQVASQTRDDDISEETQTDYVETESKWTQFPTKFTKLKETDENYLNIYKTETLGVGSDNIETKIVDSKYNKYNLSRFLQSSSQLIFTLLQGNNRSAAKEIEISDRKLPFSDGQIPFNTTFLKERPVSHISFTITGGVKMLSLHEPKKVGQNNDIDLKTIACMWDISNPSQPEDIFSTFGMVTCTCFCPNNNKLILGGLHDGTVTLWDLLESPRMHNYLDVDSKNRMLVKSASYTTTADVDYGSKIVSIHSNYDSDDGTRGNPGYNWIATVKVLTLDQVGNLIIWGLISKPSLENVQNVNFNHKYLVRNSIVSLATLNPELQDLHCAEMCVSKEDPNHVFIATNYGYTLHCLVSGAKPNPRKYSPGSLCKANAIDTCAHSHEYFLVGYDNGNISLFSRSVEKPLMTLYNQESDEAEIDIVEWSQNRPCLFYTKDKNNTIDIWDLSFSELFPTFSIPFKEGIKSIKLSPMDGSTTSNTRSYMAIVASDDQIHLHVLNKEHGRQVVEDFQGELKKFTNYVNRL